MSDQSVQAVKHQLHVVLQNHQRAMVARFESTVTDDGHLEAAPRRRAVDHASKLLDTAVEELAEILVGIASGGKRLTGEKEN